ncbi:hypothetical protein FBX97_2229 [Herbaspirillum sp. SJZ107]|nr:hypothetical protein FBX97_2229 [Herbaspirillum sp. SJZ107]
MGFPIAKMTCTSCKRTEPGVMYSRPRRYQLDSETQLPMQYHTGWCFDCDGVRNIENLSPDITINAIRRAATTLKSATAKRRWFRTGWDCQSSHWLDQGHKFVREFHTEDWHTLGSELDEQANRLVFLSQRSVPARCLECFGYNIAELTRFAGGDRTEMIHPGCGGHFILEIQGSMHLAPPTTKLIHFSDGTFSHEEAYEAPSLYSAGRLD